MTGEIGNSSGKLASESDPWSSYFLAVLLVGLFGSLASMQAGPATEPEKSVLFQSDNPAGTHYRIPGLVVTSKGTVLAYAEARINTRKDFGEIEVHLRRSTDGGKTWEPSRHIAHLGPRIEGNPLKKEDGASEQTVHNPLAVVD
ncbi:MAG: exo-alpha-sialidase, partial [Verrucomicrobia bacterium]|nr:exo-alpha-sialidase [Verrucomicrobiota bacterium]